jgi:hypothetical protein
MLLCKFCSKECKNDNSLRNHERLCKENPNKQESTLVKNRSGSGKLQACIHCGASYNLRNISKHESGCLSNPNNQKECPVCKTMFAGKSVTCSYSCSNTFFRSGKNNPNWKESSYRTTCFEYHNKTCVICGEDNIVEVHHMDENKNNNEPENLIPLCPTHHQYFHSRYKHLVLPTIQQYIKKFMDDR